MEAEVRIIESLAPRGNFLSLPHPPCPGDLGLYCGLREYINPGEEPSLEEKAERPQTPR